MKYSGVFVPLPTRRAPSGNAVIAITEHFSDFVPIIVEETIEETPWGTCGDEICDESSGDTCETCPYDCGICVGVEVVAPIGAESQDIAYQSVVFSSLLDDGFQQRLAERMWQWLRPGGAVLWYDFIYDNPTNPDVRGVPLRRVRELFPGAIITARRVTLAPPIARRVAAVHPALYTMFNAMPLLRTHVLAWIAKPARTCLGKVMTP